MATASSPCLLFPLFRGREEGRGSLKRIVICCDGTWNKPAKTRQTNVCKLYEAVLNFAADGTRQIPWYDEGAKLIGVWDTVGSLGIPVGRFQEKFQFHDVALTSWVENGFHALAIDERRQDYAPTLWEQNPDPKVKQRMEQRWFAGVHGDVGGGAGGEDDDAQSDRCLRWIIDAARGCGLEFDEALLQRTVSLRDDGKLHLGPGYCSSS